jgi:hypothetical protein
MVALLLTLLLPVSADASEAPRTADGSGLSAPPDFQGIFYLEGRVSGFAIQAQDGINSGSVTVSGVEITVDGFPTVEAGSCVEVTGTAVFEGGHLVRRVAAPDHFVPVPCDPVLCE